jgi:hypothetical protein
LLKVGKERKIADARSPVSGVKAVRGAALAVSLLYVARFTYYTQKSRIEKILRKFSAFPRSFQRVNR